jgi:hypothetical protein
MNYLIDTAAYTVLVTGPYTTGAYNVTISDDTDFNGYFDIRYSHYTDTEDTTPQSVANDLAWTIMKRLPKTDGKVTVLISTSLKGLTPRLLKSELKWMLHS